MKQRIKLLLQRLQVFLTAALTNETPEGSGLGIYLRKKLKKLDFRQWIGVYLAGFAFFAGIVVPQSQQAIASLEVTLTAKRQVIAMDLQDSPFQWPLASFGISQDFSSYHPGMDLTDPIGTPIHPIAEGKVEWVKYLPYGYGYHVLVSHDDNVQSLYAHMSRIIVHEGELVTKHTELGEIGVTGHTTGSHLHVEVYLNGVANNPLEILPELKDVTGTVEAQQ